MDALFFMLTCCLSLSYAEPTTEYWQSKTKSTTGLDIQHKTNATPLNSSEHLSTMTTLSSDTILTSTVNDNNTLPRSTSATVANASHSPTLESTTTMMTLTTTLTMNITANQTERPTSVNHTGDYTSVSETTTVTIITSANASVVNTTSQSEHTTQGLQLSISERNMTITFSVMLGVLALAVVAIKFHRCCHKLQFLHQPLNNTDDSNALTADPDTLMISGGLNDGHPIYDNVPPARQDESQFCLEFLR